MNTQIIYFQFNDLYVPFVTMQSIGFKFFPKTMKGSCVFCCSSCINFNPTSHFKDKMKDRKNQKNLLTEKENDDEL